MSSIGVYYYLGDEEKHLVLSDKDIVRILQGTCHRLQLRQEPYSGTSHLKEIDPKIIEACLREKITDTAKELINATEQSEFRISTYNSFPQFFASTRIQEDIFVFRGPASPPDEPRYWIFIRDGGGLYQHLDTLSITHENIEFNESSGEITIILDNLQTHFVTVEPGDILWPFALVAPEEVEPFLYLRHAARIEDGSFLKGLITSREGTVKHAAMGLKTALDASITACEITFLDLLKLDQVREP